MRTSSFLKRFLTVTALAGALAAGFLAARNGAAAPNQVPAKTRAELLAIREAVWRAWFAYDFAGLEKLLPDETLGINAGLEHWDSRKDAIEDSKKFKESGGRLVRIEFPRTEIQLYGNIAILYSEYLTETDTNGQREVVHGRATEVFVRRNNTWVNSGWHTDSGK
jgi:hypothetical protein